MTTLIAQIPEIGENQNNKYLTHNKGIRNLEALSVGVIEDYTSTPPVSPGNGSLYAVGAGATGDWVGLDQALVQYQDNGWVVYPVPEGLTRPIKTTKGNIRYNGTIWEYEGFTTTETLSGKTWIDGKPLYTQALTYTNVALNTPTTIASITGIDTWGWGIVVYSDAAGSKLLTDLVELEVIGNNVTLTLDASLNATNSGHILLTYTKV